MARVNAYSGRKNRDFSMLPQVKIKRSVFDRSSSYKTTLNSGFLVPFFVDEVLPGDTFNLTTSIFCRLNTPITPFLDNVWLDTHFFFVPTRLVWNNFQKFMGEQENPGDSTDYLIPTINVTPEAESIFDYFGLPINVQSTVNALPFRAYNLIFNEWFRDENLIDSLPVPKGDSDQSSNYTLQRRGKRHDYFTSALPWPQKGPAVEVGLSGNAPVTGFESATFSSADGRFSVQPLDNVPGIGASWDDGSYARVVSTIRGSGASSRDVFLGATVDEGGEGSSNTDYFLTSISGRPVFDGVSLSPSESLFADLSGVNAISINDLRQAFQIQKFYEAKARSGSRYTEILRGFFGVISPDARLQRPEYLGGSSNHLNVVPVAQNSSSNSTSPQANLAAFGLSAGVNKSINKSFVEHGYIVGLISIRADLTYQQGINRLWSRSNLFDFYWPQFAHLGEQAILNKEIYAQGNDQDNAVFGYQERYAEYRYRPSQVTGKLRSTYAQSLDVWHLAQKFDNLPTLSKDFIEENPPINRVVAVPSEPQFILDSWFSLKCVRPMPVYGVPGLVDHF